MNCKTNGGRLTVLLLIVYNLGIKAFKNVAKVEGYH